MKTAPDNLLVTFWSAFLTFWMCPLIFCLVDLMSVITLISRAVKCLSTWESD